MAQVEIARITELASHTIKNSILIVGNNNSVYINKSIENIITNLVSNLDQLMSYNLEQQDQQNFELFKYKLAAGDATDIDAKNIISILSEYAPHISLTASTISMIEALFL